MHAPESGLDGLGLASSTAGVLLASLVEPGLDARLPVLAEMVAVEDAVDRMMRTVSICCREVEEEQGEVAHLL
jgi:hypothetical protein